MRINWYYVAGAVVVAALIYKWWSDKKASKLNTSSAPTPSSGSSPTASTASAPTVAAPSVDYDKLLFRGITNASTEVKLLQTALGVTADGIFGSITEAALMQKYGVNRITLKQVIYSPYTSQNVADVLASGSQGAVSSGGSDWWPSFSNILS